MTPSEPPAGPGAFGSVLAQPLAIVRPRLRGWLHAGISPVVVVASIVLIVLAPTDASR